MKNKLNRCLKLSFDNVEYHVDEEHRNVHCTLSYSLNLEEIEKFGFSFNNSFIKNIISKYFYDAVHYNFFTETFAVKDIYVFSKKSAFPEIGNSKGVYLDKSTDIYYEFRGGEYQVVKLVKDRMFFRERKKEVYSYCPSAYASDYARCHKDDTFDVKIGKKVALEKAKRCAYRDMYSLVNEISLKLNQIQTEVRAFKENMNTFKEEETEYLKKNF